MFLIFTKSLMGLGNKERNRICTNLRDRVRRCLKTALNELCTDSIHIV